MQRERRGARLFNVVSRAAAAAAFFLLLQVPAPYTVAIHESPMSPEKIRWYRLMREGDDLVSKGNIVAASLAEENYKEALKIAERAFGKMSEQTAETLRALSLLHYKEGQYEKGFPYYDRYLELGRHNVGSNGGRDLFYAIVAGATRLGRQGNVHEAGIILDHSLDAAERHFHRQVFPPTISVVERRNLVRALIEALQELSFAVRDLYAKRGIVDKAGEMDGRIRTLMMKVQRQDIR